MTINKPQIPEEPSMLKEQKRSTHLSGVLHGNLITIVDPETRNRFINSAVLADIIESGMATPEQYLLFAQQITQKAIKTARTDIYQPRKTIELARQHGADETGLNELEANYNAAVITIYKRAFEESFTYLKIFGNDKQILKIVEDAERDGVEKNVILNFKRRLRNLQKKKSNT